MTDSFETARPVAVGRTLPNSQEAEAYVLSLCMLDGADVVGRCVLAGITPATFYLAAHGIVFGVILDLYARQIAVGMESVGLVLQQTKQLDAVGGWPFLTEVSRLMPTTAQAAHFIAKVKEQATLRAVIVACTGGLEECYNFTGDIEQLTALVGSRVARATGQGADDSEETFQATAKTLLVEVTTPTPERKAPVGEVSWGLVDIDRACGKLSPGNLVVVAGMPSTGKSAIADQVAWGAAAIGIETVMFTYEMTKREKAIRIAQQVSRLNYDQFWTAPSDCRERFTEAVRTISECRNLHVFERDVSVNRLVSRVRAFGGRGKKVGLIVVDFLQYLARLEAVIGRERTDEKIGRMTSALKAVAKECVCPVMLLSSLNREGYRDGNRPTIAALRASGDIESDADVIGILHWPKTQPNGVEQDPHDNHQNTFYVEFNQDKGRTKGVHQIGLHFDRKATRFNNYSQ